MSANTLELNRTFLQVPDTVAGLDAEATLHAALLLNSVESWDALLEHPYVVVLGEAGTGKSTEFQLRAQSMAAQGKFSFFVELFDLATDGLTQSLDVDDNTRLEEWQASQDDAVFFLDSLDEAKLQNRTLKQALRRLRGDLKDEWERVRLVVSCRASDWMAEADRSELGAVAPSGVSEVRIVQLAPLNTEQVERLAQAAGVTDVEAFMGAVADNYAHVFIERPLDVQWLGAYWVRHRRIGSLQELIVDNVREKLRERPGRPSTLSLTTADAGIKTLAGVAMINNAWAFVLPDNTLDAHRATGAVDPQEFLPDWSSVDVAELLRRPLFDEATYGRVRLHHRSVQEFLAARWVADLVSSGMAHARVLELFLREEGGEQVIPAHLGPVAAWLALWDEQLRRVLIREAPSLLIGNGDPSGFTDEERRQILRSYAKSYEGRERRFESFDHASLQRFSAPALSEPIEALLKTPDTPDELVSVLLQIADHGYITACADTCLALALDLSRASEVRYFAIRAAASIGTDSHRSTLLGLLHSTPEWEQDVAGAFVRALYPKPLDVQGLMQLLGAAKPKRRNLMTSLQVVLEHEIPQMGSIELRLELLAQLLGVVWVLDPEAEAHTVPPAQHWLLPLVARLVSSVLDELSDDAERPEDIARALTVFRWCNEHGLHIWHGLDEVKQAVARHPEIRRELFWRRVEEHRQREGSTPTRYFELRYSYEIFELNSADRGWLALDAQTRPEVRERLLAFDALSRTPAPEGDQASHLEFLREVSDGIPELTRRLNRMLNRPAALPYPRSRRWDLERRARELAQERREARNHAELKKHVNQIRAGTCFSALWFLYRNAGRSHMSYGDTTAASLEERYGSEIAEAAVAGWRAFWRTYDPPMPHERETRNSTPGAALIGLVGLKLDFVDGLDAARLNSEEARRAARYASCKLNSFPAWLAPLTVAHPEVVTTALCPSVVADMMHPDDGTLVHDVLAKLPRADDAVRAVLAPYVAKQLCAEEPPMVRALAYALDVVIGEGAVAVGNFAELACERCRCAITAEERFAMWWEAWLSVDSSGALDFLETVVGDVTPEQAYQLVLQICHRLYEYSEAYATRPLPARQQPDVLNRLIPLVYEHIKPVDDIDHEGVFSPGLRDHAQRIRSHLVSWLAEIPGAEAAQSLRELAKDPRLAEIRDWLLHLTDQRLVANTALTSPTVVQQLTDLCRSHGTNMPEHLGDLREDERMERFDVGIVTMKEEEYAALLDKFGATTCLPGVNRDYEVASVETSRGECRVAITRCAQQGNAFAQTAATEMLADLNPRFLLVVGIAGGVPTPDFCLGDVVISDYIQDLTLEDTGVGPGDERYNALGGPLHPSAGRIVERLRAVERSATGWNSAESIGCDRPSLDGEHTTDDVGWNASIDEAITTHARRDSPIGTARKVASSDRLIKAPELLQKWRKVLKAVAAVEMESAGAYVPCQRNNVPFMAIRGISDIVGWKRDEAWTLYACHTAAAYTRMLVGAGIFVLEDSAQS